MTKFNEKQNLVFLGADVAPGVGADARSRLSELACLAHELSHAQRFLQLYARPLDMPDMLIDEAETSLNAAFNAVLSSKDREDLVEDARDRTTDWLIEVREEVTEDEN